MKLADVQEAIDAFFDSISAEELYRISVEKYGFTELETSESSDDDDEEEEDS